MTRKTALNLLHKQRTTLKRVLLSGTILHIVFLAAFWLSVAVVGGARAATDFNTRTVTLINNERTRQNLPALRLSRVLSTAAFNHNKTMDTCTVKLGTTACFLHQVTLQNEPPLLDRIAKLSYQPQVVAENIAYGFKTPEDVLAAWMNSSGHRANILGSTVQDIGCSYYNANNGDYRRLFWTCDFGISFNLNSVNPSISPSPTSSAKPTGTLAPKPSPSATSRPQAMPTAQLTASLTPAPSAQPVSAGAPWWCKYIQWFSACR